MALGSKTTIVVEECTKKDECKSRMEILKKERGGKFDLYAKRNSFYCSCV